MTHWSRFTSSPKSLKQSSLSAGRVNIFLCYLAVFLSLFATLPASAADATPTESINLSGKWSDGITIQQTGQSVSAYDSTGKNIFNGVLSGQTLNGQFVMSTTSEWQGCGGPTELWPNARLTVSQSENSQTITGEQFENFKFKVSTCETLSPFWDTLSASFTRTLVVKVVSVKSKYPEDAYFMYGVSHNVTYTATIDWGEANAPDFVRFETTSGSYDIPTTSTTAEKSFDMGREFPMCGKLLKVTAFDKNGKKSEVHETNVNITDPLPGVGTPLLQLVEKGNDFSYKGNLGISFDLLNLEADAREAIANAKKTAKGSPPMFDKDSKFKTEFSPKVSIEMTSKGEANFDFEVGEGVASADKLIKGRVIGFGFTLSPKFSTSSKFDCSSNTWQWKESSLGISGGASVSPPPWYAIVMAGPVPVPLYAKLSAGVSGEGTINFMMEPELFKPKDGKFDLGVTGKGAVGAGISDVVGVEGSVTGGGNVIWMFNPQPSVDEIKGSVGVGLTVYFILYKWEPELPWNWEWSTKGTKSGRDQRSTIIGRVVEPILIPRDYLNNPDHGKFTRSTRGLRDSATDSMTLQATIYPYSDVNLSGNDKTLYAVWVADNPSRSSINRTQTVFTTWNGSEWNELQPIADDGTADFHPNVLAFADNQVVATWEDTKQVLTDAAKFEDSISNLEISVGNYNPQTQQWTTQRLTDNSYLDRSPKLSGTNGNAIMTWISNESNDLMGSATNPNKLWFAQFNNGKWSTPQLIANIPNPLLKYNTIYNGQTGHVVLSMDTDGDLTTIEDHELFQTTFNNGTWSPLTRLTTDTISDDNPQLAIAPNGILLTWFKGAEISSVVNFDFNTRTVLKKDDTGYSSNLADFKLATSPTGKLAALWAEPSVENSSDVYALFYDSTTNQWGNSKQLTFDPQTERRIAATFVGNDVIALYNRGQVGNSATTTSNGNVPVASNTDLYMLKHSVRSVDFTQVNFPELGKALAFDLQGKPISTTARFAGGISTDDKTFTRDKMVSLAEPVTIGGVITPAPEHVGQLADIVGVGYYVREGFLSSDNAEPANCDPTLVDSVAKGGYYMMKQRGDQYCSWVVKGSDADKNWCVSETEKNAVPRKRPETEGEYFSLWDGNLQSLLAIDKVTLADYQPLATENDKVLYKGRFDAPGHVCFYFGYRLPDGTLVFNGEQTINVRIKP